jgi:murein L,D-transpeptidase YafK
VRARLAGDFARVAVSYPPERIILAGFKQERTLEVWVAGPRGKPKLLRSYLVLAASGGPGPKLREGDRQVPEGIYAIESLNPNSRFHLALRVNYPNPEDLARAASEGRRDPGSDIMIHGQASSVGCLAIGDRAIEDLFVLAADTGIEKMVVLLSPVDFRKQPLPAIRPPLPRWTGGLYQRLRSELIKLQD